MNARSLASFGRLRAVDWIVPLATVWSVATVFVFFRLSSADPALAIATTVVFALAPLLLSIALRAPLVFPFCAYVAILPVDSLSRFSAFGTMSKLLGVVCAAAVVVHVVLDRSALPLPRAIVAWLALVTWMGVSVMWAPNDPEITVALSQYVTLVALLAVLALVPVTRRDLGAVCAAIVAAGAASSAYQIYLFRSGQFIISGGGRVELTLGQSHVDPNDYASSLVLPLAIALYAIFEIRSRVVRALACCAAVLMLGGLASAASRGALLASMLMVGYLVLRSRHAKKIVAALVVAISGTLAFNPAIVGRFGEASGNQGAGRGDIWRTGLRAFHERWFAGWGVGAFPFAFDANHLAVDAPHLETVWHWHAHSSIVTVATELGLVGLIFWATALVATFRLGRFVARDDELYELRVALEGAFLGVFLAGCFTTNINEKYTWLAYAMLVFLRGYGLRRAPATSVLSRHAAFGAGAGGRWRRPSHR